MDRDECIAKLESFDEYLRMEFGGSYEQFSGAELRKLINESAQEVKRILFRTGCMVRVNAAPPSAIGGMMIKNADPFEMIFQDYYGGSVIPLIRDAVQKSIGVVKGFPPGELPENKGAESIKPLVVPEKVTLKWLAEHLPIKYWGMGAGLLFAAFMLGIKAAQSPMVKSLLELN